MNKLIILLKFNFTKVDPMVIKKIISVYIRRYGKISFLSKLNINSSILDVGCGNNSSYLVKKILPKSYYSGIDVSNYNLTKPNLADEYILVEPNTFLKTLQSLPAKKFDAAISAHNLEHCEYPTETLIAIVNTLNIGGRLYLSFPSQESKSFPSRNGTLNYIDDKTHTNNIPPYLNIIKILKENDMNIIYSCASYKPKFLFFLGLLIEPLSRKINRVLPGTWEYYGFESIIWATKSSH